MKRPIQIILTVIVLAFGLLALRGQLRARAEAELWAAATDPIN